MHFQYEMKIVSLNLFVLIQNKVYNTVEQLKRNLFCFLLSGLSMSTGVDSEKISR